MKDISILLIRPHFIPVEQIFSAIEILKKIYPASKIIFLGNINNLSDGEVKRIQKNRDIFKSYLVSNLGIKPLWSLRRERINLAVILKNYGRSDISYEKAKLCLLLSGARESFYLLPQKDGRSNITEIPYEIEDYVRIGIIEKINMREVTKQVVMKILIRSAVPILLIISIFFLIITLWRYKWEKIYYCTKKTPKKK